MGVDIYANTGRDREEVAHWSYSHMNAVMIEMGLGSRFDYVGAINPQEVLLNIHKIASSSDRVVMAKVAVIALEKGVDICWD